MASKSKWFVSNKLLHLAKINVTAAAWIICVAICPKTERPKQERTARIINPRVKPGSLSACCRYKKNLPVLHKKKKSSLTFCLYHSTNCSTSSKPQFVLPFTLLDQKRNSYAIPILLNWTAFKMPPGCTAAKEIRLFAFSATTSHKRILISPFWVMVSFYEHKKYHITSPAM